MASGLGISNAEAISLGLTAVGTIATVYFVYSQTQAAKTAATTATQANTSAQQTNQRTTNMIRRINLPTGVARPGGRTGLGW